jgi:uncharacterized LabA/DUF88 family protein
MVEKAVDVMLAVDLVRMAIQDEYDHAYILSADGDYTHAAQTAIAAGKRVFAASVGRAAELAAAVSKFIPLDRPWFAECFGE